MLVSTATSQLSRSASKLIEKISDDTINRAIEMIHHPHLEFLIIILYTLPSAIAQSQSQRWSHGTLASASSVHPSLLPGRGEGAADQIRADKTVDWVSGTFWHEYIAHRSTQSFLGLLNR